MDGVIKRVGSLFTVNHDQGPKTETKGVIDGPLQAPEPPYPEATTEPQDIVCIPSQNAHIDLQMKSEKYSEKYGRLKERYNVVSHERNDLQLCVQTMESTITQYSDRIHRSESTANTLRDQLASTRAELVQVRQDLQASRSFVSTEASDDGKTLADMLSLLNRKIDELAYAVRHLVPSQMGESRFTHPNTEEGLANVGSLEALGVFAIQTNLSLADVLQYGIQHATCKHLLDILFMQFAPEIDESLSRHLSGF